MTSVRGDVRFALLALPALDRVRGVLAAADGAARVGRARAGPRRRSVRAIVTDANYFAQPRVDGRAVGRASRSRRSSSSGIAGIFLQRNRFPGRDVLVVAADVPARVSRRRRRLHGDHARRPAGTDRHDHRCAVRREAGLRLFDGGPLPRLSVFLDPARDPDGDGRRREARPRARGSGALARRIALAGAARCRAAGTAARR